MADITPAMLKKAEEAAKTAEAAAKRAKAKARAYKTALEQIARHPEPLSAEVARNALK